MDMDFDGLQVDIVQMLGGEPDKVNVLSFQNSMCNFRTKDDLLTLLIHLGYLTYDSIEAMRMWYFCHCLLQRNQRLW